jgi:hypothetical protein
MRNAFIQARTILFVGVLIRAVAVAQAPTAKSVLGAVESFNKETKAIAVKPDNAAAVTVKLLPGTIVQRIAPGQTSLANAVTIGPSDIMTGDRVLVTLASNGTDALRVVIIAASDIAKRDEADRQDWAQRGITGIVSAKNGNQILLKLKTPRGDVQQTISVSEKTKFRQYSPDSVRFVDARPSTLDAVSIGDQIRARGEKSSDGLHMEAEEIVFGTFLTRAGSVVSLNVAPKEIVVKELGSGKSFTIRLTPDSSIKEIPATPEGLGLPAAGANLAQVVERLPVGKFEEIKPGTSVVVSGTKGSEADRVTAILLVTNADPLIRMAATPSGRGGTIVFGSNDGSGLGVLGLQ